MAELDRRTIEEVGVPGSVLMESAATACVQVLLESFRAQTADGVSVLCGPGNNGGDGLAIARQLAQQGIEVDVLMLGPADRLRGDAATQAERARACGLSLQALDEPWKARGVLVDALFGTGLARTIDGVAAHAIEALNESHRNGTPVLSVDIPSGISGSSGARLGSAVHADITVSFHAAKRGHFLYPGREHRGELVVADIGIPAERWPGLTANALRLLDGASLAQRLPRGPETSHKGSFGHVLVAAGGPGKAGAARLCAEAALRAGAGLVTLALPEALAPDSVAEMAPEVMIERIPGTSDGCLSPASADALVELAATRQALAIGPGIGTAEETRKAVLDVLERVEVPHVVDADALNCLAAAGLPTHANKAERVLTPHPGEMRRLLRLPEDQPLVDRLSAVRQLAREGRSVALLKGASSLVADPEGTIWLNATGNPGMATAGSGDVLTGMIGALLARGLGGSEAATTGALWHGLAGDHAARVLGQPSMMASDILTQLGPSWLAASQGQVSSSIRTVPTSGERAP